MTTTHTVSLTHAYKLMYAPSFQKIGWTLSIDRIDFVSAKALSLSPIVFFQRERERERHTHTHTQTYVHTNTHTHTHTYTNTVARAHTYIHTCMY